MKKLIPLLLVLILLASLAACKTTPASTTPETSDTTTTETTTTTAAPPTESPDMSHIVADDATTTTDAITTTTDAITTTTDAITTTTGTITTTTGTTKTKPNPVASTTPTTKPPMTEEKALALMNSATKKAVDAKAGYKKTRTTTITNLDFGPLGKLQIVKDAVYGFLGVGTKDYTVNKNEGSNLLRASTLRAADVSSVTWQANGGGYIITVNVNEGGTRWPDGTESAPMDKGPLCYGTDNNRDYDHKTARNVHAAINGEENASCTGVGERASGVKFVATVDASGRLTGLTADFTMHMDIDSVKYTIITLKNKTGDGIVHVAYSDFEY